MLSPAQATRCILFASALLGGCDTDGDKEDDSGTAVLRWYSTCGDPACGPYEAAQHTNAACSTQVEGEGCEVAGQGCDLQVDCNTELLCATEDPKLGEGGCPISLRSFKEDIHYLAAPESAALHQELMGLRLAEYRYKTEPGGSPQHLGFLIDDQRPGSPLVRSSGDRVDLYGYTSMAVAALQVQEAQLRAQQAQLQAQALQLESQARRIEELEVRIGNGEGKLQ